MRALISITAAAALTLSVVQCVSPRPSAEPLGWGALPPGALSASHRPNSRTLPASGGHEQTAIAAAAASDAGRGEPEKVAAAPNASASSGPPETKPPTTQPSSPALAEFVGDYLGEDVATYRISGLPDRTERDPKARITVKASAGSELLFVLVDSSNGKEICTLSGNLKDSTASVAAGQKCFEQNEGEASAGATVKKGSASLDKKRLVFELDLDFEMNVEGRKLTGSLTYRFDGKRQ